jgi:hypothetical protein
VLPRAATGKLLDVAARRGWIDARTARAAKIAGVPVLVLGALVWLVVVVFRTGGVGPPPVYAEFIDPSSSSYLDVQLDRAMTSYGAFSAVVQGEGRVWPVGRVHVRQQGPGVELRYEGVGYRDPKVQPGGKPVDPVVSRRPHQTVHLRLVGQVDPTSHTASVDVVVNGASHHIASAGAVGDAREVVDDYLGALVTRNWDQLYSMGTTSMRQGAARKDYVAEMANGGAVTCIRHAEAINSTTYSTTPAGVSYARTPVRLTYGPCAGTTKVEATLVLVVDGGSWKALSLE